MNVLIFCIFIGLIVLAKCEDPVGHMQPLGSHMPPEEVDILNTVPNPIEFFEQYVKPGKPVVFSGAAKAFPSYENWKDDVYLREMAGRWRISPEIGKKENRDLGTERMIFKDFIDVYKNSNIYLVEDIVPPNPLASELYMLKSISCGGFKERLTHVILWFSSGGTKSVLHYDKKENINCIFDGTKDLVLFDRRYGERVPIDHTKGYSDVDVEKVDLHKYSTLQNLQWHHAHMEAGDCLYIPYRWFHHVNSSNTRNLAINIWWDYLNSLELEDCPDDSAKFLDFSSLKNWKPVDPQLSARSLLWSLFCDTRGSISKSDVLEFLQEFNIGESKANKMFQDMDRNGDGNFSEEEFEYIPVELINLVLSEQEDELTPYRELKIDKRKQEL